MYPVRDRSSREASVPSTVKSGSKWPFGPSGRHDGPGLPLIEFENSNSTARIAVSALQIPEAAPTDFLLDMPVQHEHEAFLAPVVSEVDFLRAHPGAFGRAADVTLVFDRRYCERVDGVEVVGLILRVVCTAAVEGHGASDGLPGE